MDGYKKFQSANNVICIKGLNPDRFKNVGKYAKLNDFDFNNLLSSSYKDY